MDKLSFLKNEFAKVLASIAPDTLPHFGKMSVHQMIEHMGYAFKQASGLIPLEQINDDETTAKMHRFMMSNKPFRDNTPNPYLPDEPDKAQYNTVSESLNYLQKDIEHFLSVFANNPDQKVANPFFGNLGFDEWVHLLHKHAHHHLRQFGVDENVHSED
jgi:hypothetical protein